MLDYCSSTQRACQRGLCHCAQAFQTSAPPPETARRWPCHCRHREAEPGPASRGGRPGGWNQTDWVALVPELEGPCSFSPTRRWLTTSTLRQHGRGKALAPLISLCSASTIGAADCLSSGPSACMLRVRVALSSSGPPPQGLRRCPGCPRRWCANGVAAGKKHGAFATDQRTRRWNPGMLRPDHAFMERGRCSCPFRRARPRCRSPRPLEAGVEHAQRRGGSSDSSSISSASCRGLCTHVAFDGLAFAVDGVQRAGQFGGAVGRRWSGIRLPSVMSDRRPPGIQAWPHTAKSKAVAASKPRPATANSAAMPGQCARPHALQAPGPPDGGCWHPAAPRRPRCPAPPAAATCPLLGCVFQIEDALLRSSACRASST